uniref:Uncharacterized protein n=1 Tax=Cacopsylla melanoneura TaxID=428564 RepID=A0A8D8QFX2_9HEMI
MDYKTIVTPDEDRSCDSGFRDKGSLSDNDLSDNNEEMNNLLTLDKLCYDQNELSDTHEENMNNLLTLDKLCYDQSGLLVNSGEEGPESREGEVNEEYNLNDIEDGLFQDLLTSSGSTKTGWYLHEPPCSSQDVFPDDGAYDDDTVLNRDTLYGDEYESSDDEEEWWRDDRKFLLNSDVADALRKELSDKLPPSSNKKPEEVEEKEPEEELIDTRTLYLQYPKSLSPILEESENEEESDDGGQQEEDVSSLVLNLVPFGKRRQSDDEDTDDYSTGDEEEDILVVDTVSNEAVMLSPKMELSGRRYSGEELQREAVAASVPSTSRLPKPFSPSSDGSLTPDSLSSSPSHSPSHYTISMSVSEPASLRSYDEKSQDVPTLPNFEIYDLSQGSLTLQDESSTDQFDFESNGSTPKLSAASQLKSQSCSSETLYNVNFDENVSPQHPAAKLPHEDKTEHKPCPSESSLSHSQPHQSTPGTPTKATPPVGKPVVSTPSSLPTVHLKLHTVPLTPPPTPSDLETTPTTSQSPPDPVSHPSTLPSNLTSFDTILDFVLLEKHPPPAYESLEENELDLSIISNNLKQFSVEQDQRHCDVIEQPSDVTNSNNTRAVNIEQTPCDVPRPTDPIKGEACIRIFTNLNEESSLQQCNKNGENDQLLLTKLAKDNDLDLSHGAGNNGERMFAELHEENGFDGFTGCNGRKSFDSPATQTNENYIAQPTTNAFFVGFPDESNVENPLLDESEVGQFGLETPLDDILKRNAALYDKDISSPLNSKSLLGCGTLFSNDKDFGHDDSQYFRQDSSQVEFMKNGTSMNVETKGESVENVKTQQPEQKSNNQQLTQIPCELGLESELVNSELAPKVNGTEQKTGFGEMFPTGFISTIVANGKTHTNNLDKDDLFSNFSKDLFNPFLEETTVLSLSKSTNPFLATEFNESQNTTEVTPPKRFNPFDRVPESTSETSTDPFHVVEDSKSGFIDADSFPVNEDNRNSVTNPFLLDTLNCSIIDGNIRNFNKDNVHKDNVTNKKDQMIKAVHSIDELISTKNVNFAGDDNKYSIVSEENNENDANGRLLMTDKTSSVHEGETLLRSLIETEDPWKNVDTQGIATKSTTDENQKKFWPTSLELELSEKLCEDDGGKMIILDNCMRLEDKPIVIESNKPSKDEINQEILNHESKENTTALTPVNTTTSLGKNNAEKEIPETDHVGIQTTSLANDVSDKQNKIENHVNDSVELELIEEKTTYDSTNIKDEINIKDGISNEETVSSAEIIKGKVTSEAIPTVQILQTTESPQNSPSRKLSNNSQSWPSLQALDEQHHSQLNARESSLLSPSSRCSSVDTVVSSPVKGRFRNFIVTKVEDKTGNSEGAKKDFEGGSYDAVDGERSRHSASGVARVMSWDIGASSERNPTSQAVATRSMSWDLGSNEGNSASQVATSSSSSMSWDIGSTSPSSSDNESTEFVWTNPNPEDYSYSPSGGALGDDLFESPLKYTHLTSTTPEHDNEVEESSGSEEDDETNEEFVPSSWDSEAVPVKSLLKIKKNDDEAKKKSVMFKKQRYHCVYEYPREEPPPSHTPPPPPHTHLWSSSPSSSPFANWGSSSPATSSGTNFNFDFVEFSTSPAASGSGFLSSDDGEFYISSSLRPFSGVPLPGGGLGALPSSTGGKSEFFVGDLSGKGSHSTPGAGSFFFNDCDKRSGEASSSSRRYSDSEDDGDDREYTFVKTGSYSVDLTTPQSTSSSTTSPSDSWSLSSRSPNTVLPATSLDDVSRSKPSLDGSSRSPIDGNDDILRSKSSLDDIFRSPSGVNDAISRSIHSSNDTSRSPPTKCVDDILLGTQTCVKDDISSASNSSNDISRSPTCVKDGFSRSTHDIPPSLDIFSRPSHLNFFPSSDEKGNRVSENVLVSETTVSSETNDKPNQVIASKGRNTDEELIETSRPLGIEGTTFSQEKIVPTFSQEKDVSTFHNEPIDVRLEDNVIEGNDFKLVKNDARSLVKNSKQLDGGVIRRELIEHSVSEMSSRDGSNSDDAMKIRTNECPVDSSELGKEIINPSGYSRTKSNTTVREENVELGKPNEKLGNPIEELGKPNETDEIPDITFRKSVGNIVDRCQLSENVLGENLKTKENSNRTKLINDRNPTITTSQVQNSHDEAVVADLSRNNGDSGRTNEDPEPSNGCFSNGVVDESRKDSNYSNSTSEEIGGAHDVKTVRKVENDIKTIENVVKTVENNIKTVGNDIEAAGNNIETTETDTKTLENYMKIVGNDLKSVVKELSPDAKCVRTELRTVEKQLKQMKSAPNVGKDRGEISSAMFSQTNSSVDDASEVLRSDNVKRKSSDGHGRKDPNGLVDGLGNDLDPNGLVDRLSTDSDPKGLVGNLDNDLVDSVNDEDEDEDNSKQSRNKLNYVTDSLELRRHHSVPAAETSTA